MRNRFIATTIDLLDNDPRTALVLADITSAFFTSAAERHPYRVRNLGIREQLMIGVAGGMALTGLRPIVHSYATFAVDRVYEQLKLDLGHQGVGAVVVSVGASYDGSGYGYTHFSPEDVALIDTLPDWRVRVPGHPAEVEALLRADVARDDRAYLRLSSQANDEPWVDADGLVLIRRGGPAAPVVVAVGPSLRPVLAAAAGQDVTVAYTHTPRPFDVAGLRALVGAPARVVLVEPYLAGTSSRVVAEALRDLPHQLLAIGVGRADLRRYGDPSDHDRWHGLDPTGIRRAIAGFVGVTGPV